MTFEPHRIDRSRHSPATNAAWTHMNTVLDSWRRGAATDAEYQEAFDRWARMADAEFAPEPQGRS